MNKLLFLGFFLLLFSSLFSKQRIEIIVNDLGPLSRYQDIFASTEFEVRECDLSRLKKGKISSHVEKIIFMNTPERIKKYPLDKLPKEKMILFMWEPPLWKKKMYSPKINSHFSRVYTWNDDLVDGKTFFKFYYPSKKPMITKIPPFEEKKFCTLINSSFTRYFPGELYSERIKAIRFFEKKEEKFEFYGKNWNAAEYPSYRGEIPDKIIVNKNYKFTICYENCNLPGYISEKIFDCFAAGSIPIYLGAPNIEEYIPKDCFIDWRDFFSLEELYAFLKNMTEGEYEGYLERIRTYLDSEEAQVFSPEYFEEILLRAVMA
ncbi:MAG: hypothetical protein K1000chlam3_01295 [Chlamydiae bacterium]|nr:hypothetical protein [Chlamydiota bacterium]